MTTTAMRPAVTPERIAEASLALLDGASDESALTMRSLAARLGIQAPSLYAHVVGMAEIHDLVHALINSGIDVSVVTGSEDLEDLAEFGRRYRRAYRQHRVAASIIMSRGVNGDHALRIYEAIAAFMLRYGIPPERVMPLMALFDNLVLGSAVEPFSAAFTDSVEDYALHHPGLAAALDSVDRGIIDDTAFECGLATFLNLMVTQRLAGDDPHAFE
jgi:AcrR family transcriptional regulator